MTEIKCSNCGHLMQVSQEVFDSLAAQVQEKVIAREVTRIKEEYDVKFKLLRAELENAERKNNEQLSKKLSEKEIELSMLRADVKAKVAEVNIRMKDILAVKENEINELKNQIKAEKNETRLQLQTQKVQSDAVIRDLEEQVKVAKDMKLRLSTKMLGETLEQHCAIEFANAQSLGLFPDAKFEKDNDTRPGGTKGDFVFRDYVDGQEYVSIMFEMKNEADETVTKHKNADFFEKLDKDRREKNCEFAVLVSMLERDSERYNAGIVNIHNYDKMYVIRPQLFMQTIAIIANNAKRNMKEIVRLRHELELARSQSVDVSNFEEKRNRFAQEFSNWVQAGVKKHNDAIAKIDKAIAGLETQIKTLQDVKKSFEASDKKFIKASDEFSETFTVKTLTRGNKTMKRLFDEARGEET